jgi:glycosyl transferase family 87
MRESSDALVNGALEEHGQSGSLMVVGPLPDAEETPEPRRGWRHTWRRVVAACRPALPVVAIAAAAHVLVLLVATAATYDSHLPVQRALYGWDAHWYLAIAHSGYPHVIPSGQGDSAQSALGFLPLLPVLIWAASEVLRVGTGVAGQIVTTLTTMSAAVMVWLMLRDDEGDDRARQGTTLMVFWPAAFVLAMVYGEGLFITLVAGALLALRRRRWVWAGCLAALAPITDPVGIAVLVPCVWAAVVAIRRRRDWSSLAAPLIAPVGLVGFMAFLWAWVGTPFAWYIAQRRGWQYGAAPFWGIPRQFVEAVREHLQNPNPDIKVVSTLVVLGLLIWMIRSRPEPLYLAYVVPVLVLGAYSGVISWSPRLALRAFPLIVVAGARLPRRWATPVIASSAVLMAVLATFAFGNTPYAFTP